MADRNEPARILVIAVVTLAAVGVLMGLVGWNAGGSTWMTNWGWAMMGGMGFMMLIPVLLVVLLVYALNAAGRSSRGEDPQAILDGRLARGEVSRDEYVRIKETLNKRG